MKKATGPRPTPACVRCRYGIAVVRLTRTVRFSINPDPPTDPGTSGPAPAGVNGFGAIPAMHGLGRHYELDASLTGEPDPSTGYLMNIKDIDRVVRAHAVRIIADACRNRPAAQAYELLPELWRALEPHLPGALDSLVWRPSPFMGVQIQRAAPRPTMSTHVLIHQSFDLAAAHRLHSSALSEEENRAFFGKCNNPNGHGHNYKIQTSIAVASAPGPAISTRDLERLIQETLIDRYDHKHLNIDTPEFDQARGGVNPTVEGIARVFFERLRGVLAHGGPDGRGATLRSITVWETDRTSATYPAS
jgi:6-pyruvoyltetrahydropterin/6-carboxytetrahydropterin synthase